MTDIAPHEWDDLQKIVRAGAKDAVRKWPGVIDADDVEQDVMLILLTSPASARTVLDADEAVQRQMVVKLAHREAAEEMSDYEHFSGQYTYDTDMVRALLDEGALTDDLEGFREEIIDLIDALQQMTWEKSVYVDPILSRYVDGEIPPPNGDSAPRVRLMRAVESLTEHMNRNHRNRSRNRADGPGSRKTMSNGSASGRLRNQESR